MHHVFDRWRGAQSAASEAEKLLAARNWITARPAGRRPVRR
jgi:hypothetical protein